MLLWLKCTRPLSTSVCAKVVPKYFMKPGNSEVCIKLQRQYFHTASLSFRWVAAARMQKWQCKGDQIAETRERKSIDSNNSSVYWPEHFLFFCRATRKAWKKRSQWRTWWVSVWSVCQIRTIAMQLWTFPVWCWDRQTFLKTAVDGMFHGVHYSSSRMIGCFH